MATLRQDVADLLTVIWLAAAWQTLAWVATALHELGHAFCLRAVGGRLRLLVIGAGPGACMHRSDWRLQVGMLPFFGCCVGSALPPGRWRRAVYLLGGPAANALAAGAAWYSARTLEPEGMPALLLWGSAFLNGWETVANLLPAAGVPSAELPAAGVTSAGLPASEISAAGLPAPGIPAVSDGAQLLALWYRGERP